MRRRGKRGHRFFVVPLCIGFFALLFGRSLAAPAREWFSGVFANEVPEEFTVPAADSRTSASYYVFEPSGQDEAAEPAVTLPEVVSAEASENTSVTITNKGSYDIDVQALLNEPLGISLDADAPQILIIHSHGSESYAPDGEDIYAPTDPSRTEDKNYNVVRVGDELTEALTEQGFIVIHDRELYDYPSYNGSYTRSLEAIERYLAEYPSIKLVLDIHRDAVYLEDGSLYKTVCSVDGEAASQVMLCVGTDESGLNHPNWRENLKLALKLQQAMNEENSALARPVAILTGRYNQHATTGSLIVEVGYNGNTLQEALNAVRAFASAAGTVFDGLIE